MANDCRFLLLNNEEPTYSLLLIGIFYLAIRKVSVVQEVKWN